MITETTKTLYGKETLCIYHGGCTDGFAAAWVVWQRFGSEADYYPATYGEDPPDVRGKDVFIVDFSYKRPVMEKILEDANSVVVLDHHKTARDDLESLFATDRPDLEGEFDMERCGAMLAWNWFFPEKLVPWLLEYIQDRDLWRLQLPATEQFILGLRSYPQEFERWNDLSVPACVEAGEHILRYYKGRCADVQVKAYRKDIGGYNVPVCNAPFFIASEIAGNLAQGEPFAACFWITEHGITYSLRSRKGGIDVSELAKKFGGGGHPGAAGFTVHHEDSCIMNGLDLE